MFISKSTIQILSLYFMIILFTNTLLCGEVVENTQNELVNNNNVNDNNRSQSTNRWYFSYFKKFWNGATQVLTSVASKTKDSALYLKNKVIKPKPVVVQTNHDPSKRVQEPIIKNRDNGFYVAEGFIAYFLEFFCQNNFYIQDTDTELFQKITEKFKKIRLNGENKDVNGNNNTTQTNNTTLSNITTQTNNTTQTDDISDADTQKVFPSGDHLLTEKCFENGFLKCKDSDHTKEIFDLIFTDDEQISKLISIDEKILKDVISYKKMYTISENNKIVEFLNLLLKNKPNDTNERLNKSNKNGYNLIYPKVESTASLVVCLLKGVFEKIKMNYEENEKRSKQNVNGQESVGQGDDGQDVVRQESLGQNMANNQEIPPTNNQEIPQTNNQFIPLRELEID